MTFKKKLIIIGVIAALVCVIGIVMLLVPASDTIMKIGTVCALFGAITLIAIAKAYTELNFQEEVKSGKVSDTALQYKHMNDQIL